MKITPAFLDELKTRVPLAQVIGRRVKLTKRGKDYLGLCPFHKEKTPSFNVVEDKGFYHCFGCGKSGDVVSFVQETENLSFPEAVEKLAGEAGMEVPQDTPQDRARAAERDDMVKLMEAAAAWFEAQLKTAQGGTARRYLEERGLDADVVRRFRLGYAPDTRSGLKSALMADGWSEEMLVRGGLAIRPPEGDRPSYDRFRGRVMFPIRDRRGRVIAFGGRILGDGEPKYLNSPETPLFHKGRTLYNIDRALKGARETGRLIVAEGYMDVIALDRAGFAGAVAPLGTALTEDQIRELWRVQPEPVLCLDGDTAGRRAALRAGERALPLLEPGKSLRFAFLPEGEDPDSVLELQGRDALAQALDAAQPLAEVLWQAERHAAPIDTPERQAEFKKRLYGQARQIANATVRELYIADFRRRVDALFAAPERPGRHWRGAPPRPGGAALRAHHDVDVLFLRQQQGFLAAIINHPEILDEVGEVLGQATFSPPALDSLRREILKTWHSDLDSNGLEDHLRQIAGAETVDRVLARNVYVLAPFARPETETAEALEGWRHAWRSFVQRRQQAEYGDAVRELADDMTGERWARVDALRQLVVKGDEDERELDGT